MDFLARFLSVLTALTFILFVVIPAPHAFAQEEDADLDLESSDTGGNFDDLQQELDAEAPKKSAEPPGLDEPSAPPVAEEPAKPAPPAEDDLDLGPSEDEKQAQEPAPPAVEEPQAEVAKPEEPTEIAPEAPENAAEPEAAPPPPTEEEAPVFRSENDTPDEEFEARMARIYKQFYGARTSDAEWTQIVGPKASERYSVQNGDTLWGISQTFFGNGFFWPKLWQLNAEFTNPHLLEISDSIQFSPGTVSTEPVINLTQKASKYNEPDAPRASVTPEQAKAYMANVQMPPALPHRPVINKIPNSLPLFDNVTSGFDSSGFSLDTERRFTISDITHLGFSISDSFPNNDGELIEVETGGGQLNIFQEGVAELDGAKVGDRYYAFRVSEKIRNEFGSGYPIEYQGEIEVLESIGNGRYRVLCLEAITQVLVGSRLRKGNMPKANYSKNGTPGNVAAKVFGGHYDSDRQSLAAGNLIYLAGGKYKGLQINQLLTILKNYKLRNPDTVLREPEEPIALIKILNVAGNVSTALVLESRDELRQGDITGPGDVY